MAIVVLGIAIPPLVTLFTEVAAHSADHTYQGVALAYAEGLLEEIVSKAYEDPQGSSPTSFVAAADSSSATETTSHTVTIPAHSSGDLLVLAFTQSAGATSPATATNTPSGWTLIRNLEAGDASAVRLTVFTKVGNGSESSVAVTTSVATGFGGTCCAYSGVSGVVDISGEAQKETGTDMSAPTVTTTEASTRVIWCFAFDDDLASQADVDSDAGFQGTLRGYEEQALPGNGFACAVSDTSLASAGASGACVFSTNGDSDAGCAITLALRATDPSTSFGPEEGSRAAYDDVDDFDGLSNSPPERIDGTALSDYGGFTRSVTVDNVTAAVPDPVTPEADGSTEFKRIRVTVTWTGAGAGEITLSTLRTLL